MFPRNLTTSIAAGALAIAVASGAYAVANSSMFTMLVSLVARR